MDTGCFSLLAIVQIGALNLGGDNTFKLLFSFSSNKYPQDELLGHTVVFFFNNLHTVLHSGCTNL